VRRHAGEESTRPAAPEGGSRQHRRGQQCGDSEGRDLEWMPGHAQRSKKLVEQGLLVSRGRGEEAPVPRRVAAQPRGGVVDGALEENRVLAVQWVRQRRARMDELEAVPARRKIAEEAGR